MKYMVYKFGGLSKEQVLRNRKDLFIKYGHENWFIFDRDCKIPFNGDKVAIRNWCLNYISSLHPSTVVVIDVRNGVGRLGWEEIRAAEKRGLRIETFGGPLPIQRSYLGPSFEEVLNSFTPAPSLTREVEVSIEKYRSLLG